MGKGDFLAKVIAIANQKGGVGKTTTAVNLAACLGALGKRTLLIDVDPQGNATSGVAVDKRQLTKSTYNILVDGASAEECLFSTQYENLHIIPSSLNLAAAELEIADKPHREAILKNSVLPPTLLQWLTQYWCRYSANITRLRDFHSLCQPCAV